MTTIGILHPGSMGAAVGGELTDRGFTVLWCPKGRSAESASRAEKFGLQPADSLQDLVVRSSVVVSLCPSDVAESVALDVAEAGFTGCFLEANAISPARMAAIAERLGTNGATVVDGGVVGSPPSATRSPRLYLSGPADDVAAVAELFAGTRVQPVVLDGEVGQASALKLSYTAYQKASRVLAAVAHAFATDFGVGSELVEIAEIHSARHLAEPGYTSTVAELAWRWESELREVAAALDGAGLPAGIVAGSADVMARWAGNRGAEVNVETAIAQLHR